MDAHVGKALFHGAICTLRDRGKSVILVTHALHFLSKCDYIYALDNGTISEQGTYFELLENPGEFARLVKEFGGGGEEHQKTEPEPLSSEAATVNEERLIKTKDRGKVAGTGRLEGRLIVKEKRTTGSVSWQGM